MSKTPKDVRRIKYQRTHKPTIPAYPDDITQGLRRGSKPANRRETMRSLLLSILSMSLMAIDLPQQPIPSPYCVMCDYYPDHYGDGTP
jgi:hypothetical protein